MQDPRKLVYQVVSSTPHSPLNLPDKFSLNPLDTAGWAVEVERFPEFAEVRRLRSNALCIALGCLKELAASSMPCCNTGSHD
jgi:hypothetical protein